MLINEVSKLCNITKKAIEYYIQQGLVCPNILENGYRNFSKDDIKILKEISLYRKLGLSVYDIKGILENQSELKSFLYKKSIDIEKEKIKQDILNRLCNGAELKDLEDEINNINFNSSIIRKLLDLFPGYFGKFICLNFSFYLMDKIETKKQMEGFKEVVEFLDNTSDIMIPKDLIDYLDTYLYEYSGDDGIERIKQIRYQSKKNYENIDSFIKENKEILKEYDAYKKTDEYKNSPAYRLMKLMKEFCLSNGYYDKFIPAMRKLSPTYNEYYEKMIEANKYFVKKYKTF